MAAATLMVQGTTSDAGKSLVVAALCRILSDKGIRVAPFKGQNMALNSYATLDGYEIGRAQALQAEAARINPTVDMNPILLKPTDGKKSQVIVRGKIYKTLSAREYYAEKAKLLEVVKSSLDKLRNEYEVVLIEGAGSPAEINLKEEDIANMKVAKLAKAPVLLVADIDRGGVFASIIGTLELLDEDEKELVKGLIINKFRGDVTLLDSGIDFLENRTGKRYLGTIPYLTELKIDSEDSLALDRNKLKMQSRNHYAKHQNIDGVSLADLKSNSDKIAQKIVIAVIRLPHISNFTDFDPFMHEMDVDLKYVHKGEKFDDADCIIIPGTKNTMSDLKYLHESGFTEEICALRKKGIPVVGICGGYQMLGKFVYDPHKIESNDDVVKGLGLLDCTTVLNPEKITMQVEAIVVDKGEILGTVHGKSFSGYEIHMGQTELEKTAKEAFQITKRGKSKVDIKDGCISEDGLVIGTYIHGIFDNDIIRKSLLDFIRQKKGLTSSSLDIDYYAFKQTQLDILAQTVKESLDMDFIYSLIGV